MTKSKLKKMKKDDLILLVLEEHEKAAKYQENVLELMKRLTRILSIFKKYPALEKQLPADSKIEN